MDNPVQLATLLRQLITEAGVLLPSSEQLSMGRRGLLAVPPRLGSDPPTGALGEPGEVCLSRHRS
jgi:hypothetical protein